MERSSDTPPGYVARARFRYEASSAQWRVLKACRRAGAVLWRKVADPSPVSRSASPISRGRRAWLDACHSLQIPYRAARGPRVFFSNNLIVHAHIHTCIHVPTATNIETSKHTHFVRDTNIQHIHTHTPIPSSTHTCTCTN